MLAIASLRNIEDSVGEWTDISYIGVGTMGAPGAAAPLYFLTVTLC